MGDPAHLDVSKHLTLESVVQASRFQVRLRLAPSDAERLDAVRRQVMTGFADGDERVYGFNTGFGDNRSRPTVPKAQRGTIQDNLILSHASGFGDPIEPEVVRAAIAIRARTLAIGHSGIRARVLSALCSLYNSGLVPVVPRFGSVGASGDLAPLSHLALPLMGKGRVHVDGRLADVDRSLLKSKGVEELSYRPSDEFPGVQGENSVFGPKEGLALNNGTSFMAAWLALSVAELENVLWHADLALALNLEAMCGVTDAYLPSVQKLRAHTGVNASSARVLAFLEGSELVFRKGRSGDRATEARTVNASVVVDSIQDDYCLRSGSVVHGTALDALGHASGVVETEVNSVTDNPVLVDGEVLSGSHFHGMPLALAADQLRTAMAIVGGISERRVAKLLNDRRNYGLARHLVIDDDGLKSGWMIAQYTTASMVSELKTRSMPYCVGNVTTGNESEDFVSMGANACRAAYECVAVLRGIVAIELAAAVRALLIRVGRTSDKSDLSDTGLSFMAQRVVKAFVDAGIDVWHTDDRPLASIFEESSSILSAQTLKSSSTTSLD